MTHRSPHPLAVLACATLGCTAPNPAYQADHEGDGATSRDDAATTASSASATSTPLPGTGGASSGGTTEPDDTTNHASSSGSTSDDPPPVGSSGEPEPRRALLVTQSGNISLPLDVTLAASLAELDFEVVPMADSVVTIADADAVDLVVISETATVLELGDRLREVARPTIVLEGQLWNDMSMAPFSTFMPGTDIYIAEEAVHEIAAGLSGEVAVLVEDLGAGVFGALPPPSAHVIAHAFDAVGPIAVFAFEAGAPMEGGFPAPAARVALGFDVDGNGATPSTADLTPEGVAIFTAAVQWAAL